MLFGQHLFENFSKSSKFSIDIFGVLLNAKNEKDTVGIFLDTSRVWDKTNAYTKEHLRRILKVFKFSSLQSLSDKNDHFIL